MLSLSSGGLITSRALLSRPTLKF